MSVAGRRSGGVDRRLRAAAILLRSSFVPLLAIAALQGSASADLGNVAFGATVAFLPVLVERFSRHRIPALVHVATALAAIVEATGRTLDLYESHPLPFDVLAHAVIAGAVALVVLEASGYSSRLWREPTIVVFAGAGIAGGLGVAWEIVEGVAEALLPTTLQHGLDDTILDILAGTFGGAMAGYAIHRYHAIEATASPSAAAASEGAE